MCSSILLAFCLLTFVADVSANNSTKSPVFNESNLEVYKSMGAEADWKFFMRNYNKTYANETEQKRREGIFAKNLDGIVTHNKLYTNGLQTSFTLAVNGYSDLETSEVLRQMTGLKAANVAEVKQPYTYTDTSKPTPPEENVDFVEKGFVTPVKNQLSCGSCWAFATTGTLEGQIRRTTGILKSLSEQQLVDCNEKNGACNGGWPHIALEYIRDNGGINDQETYPYDATKGNCRFKSDKVAAKCTGYAQVDPSETALMKAVYELGPIAVAIDISPPSFQQYRDGVYDDPTCSNKTNNHAVLVVGYGSTPSGKKYWIVKNSWGTGWGNGGYIFMSRNKENQCGIANYAVYPVV